MRLSENTRFPYPVLSPGSSDYAEGAFDVQFLCAETFETGQVELAYTINLDEPDIRNLVEGGLATAGAFIRCRDTHYSALEKLAWPSGKIEFAEGALLNRVSVRPLIWLNEPRSWHPQGANAEFDLPVALSTGAVIAIAEASVLSVGQAKLTPLESIFHLRRSETLPAEGIAADPNNDKIMIEAGSAAFQTIQEMRDDSRKRGVLMSSVYLPVVMDTLDQVRQNVTGFEGRRWFTPFSAQCAAHGIDFSNISVLEDAQKLLGMPISALARALADGEA